MKNFIIWTKLQDILLYPLRLTGFAFDTIKFSPTFWFKGSFGRKKISFVAFTRRVHLLKN